MYRNLQQQNLLCSQEGYNNIDAIANDDELEMETDTNSNFQHHNIRTGA